MSWARHRTAAVLARWLGPWASEDGAPPGVTRETDVYAPLDPSDPPVRGYRYEPQGAVSGTYLVIQGLHYQGPDDPRMDRFCRVLAAAGFVVLAPFLDDFLELRVTPWIHRQVVAACHAAVTLSARRGLPRPALFSISFGSMPAIEVAASERFRDAIGSLVMFGGFHDFYASIRFAITGRAFHETRPIAVPHDPLNAPAVFVNLVDFLEEAEGQVEPLRRAWLEMARRTWGRRELFPTHKRVPIAEALADELPRSHQQLFLVGCGLAEGGGTVLESGLAHAEQYFAFTNPRPHLSRIAAPVVISHGRDDDVIPYSEAHKLAAALPSGHRHRVHITGMYGHTGTALPDAGAAVTEARQMKDLLYSLVDAPHEAL